MHIYIVQPVYKYSENFPNPSHCLLVSGPPDQTAFKFSLFRASEVSVTTTI